MIEKGLVKFVRLEVIDDDGRSYKNYLEEDQFVRISIQDDGCTCTLKIFVERDE